MKRNLADEAATLAFADELARALPADIAGWTVLLQGELGAGKSTLARGLIRALGHSGPVPSPTYTLVEPYELGRGNVYHIDLYRISDTEELHFLGWDELDNGLRLVEWPERAAALLQRADLWIRLAYRGSGRELALSAGSARGEALIGQLSS